MEEEVVVVVLGQLTMDGDPKTTLSYNLKYFIIMAE